MAFDWQTGEEEDLHSWREEKRARRPAPRWPWLLALLVVFATGWMLWQTATRRIESQEEAIREDVRVSHALVQRAAADADVEVLRTVLSGSDEAWADAQKDLLARGAGHTAVSRLLGLEPAGDPVEVELGLEPELRTAELVLRQTYFPLPQSGLTGTVTLQQTFVFRRGSNRWLLAPPPDSFWGALRTMRQDSLTVRYPERDETIALRLGRDLQADVKALCRQLPAYCPSDLALSLTLSTSAASLLAFDDGAVMLRSGRDVTLPAPSLLGVPQDETSYQLLHQVYARYLLGALSADLLAWDCCNHALFFQALLQQLLHETGVHPSPLVPDQEVAAALALAAASEPLQSQLPEIWFQQQPVGPGEALPLLPRLFVAFLLDEAEAQEQGVVEMITALAADPSLSSWWRTFAAPSFRSDLRLPQTELFASLRERYQPPPLPPGLALPPTDILFSCAAEDGMAMWRYEPQADRWTEEMVFREGEVEWGEEVFPDPVPLSMVALPGERYFLLLLSEDDDVQVRLLYGEPGRAATVVPPEPGGVWIPLQKHAWHGSREGNIPVFRFDFSTSEMPSMGIVSLADCAAERCPWQETPGLLAERLSWQYEVAGSILEGSPIWLRPVGGEWQEVAQGRFPFWLDEQTFAYFQGAHQSRMQLLVAQEVEGESRELADAGELDFRSNAFSLSATTVFVAGTALDPDTIFLLASSWQERRGWLLTLQRPAGASWLDATLREELIELEGSMSGTGLLLLSPRAGERWLTVPLRKPDDESVLWIYDILQEYEPFSVPTRHQEWLLPAFDWSPDGQWIAIPHGRLVYLLAPATLSGAEPYRQLLFAPAQTCDSALWLEP